MEWIKPKDKMPEPYSTIFVTVEEEGERIVDLVEWQTHSGWFQSLVRKKNWGDEIEYFINDVIAWSYGPEPYKD